MKISHLRAACYLYNQFTGYDSSYIDLQTKHSSLKLDKKEHVIDLIRWLRSWGCRQFKNDDEKISVNSIKNWYKLNRTKIPKVSDSILSYDLENNRQKITYIFNELSNRCAATRNFKGREIEINIGPVGAAKTLFALRPNLFSPWDTPIYKKLEHTGDGDGYVNYLLSVQKELKDIRKNLSNTNVDWSDLFNYLKKRHTSYPKLIDEYYWVTITQGCEPSELEEIFRQSG